MSSLKDTANTLYRVLSGTAASSAQLEAASDWFEKLDTPIDRRSFLAYMQALQRDLPATSPLAGLASKWSAGGSAPGGFSTSQAQAFLQDYIAHLDPNLLFRQPITAGYAHWDRRSLQQGFAYGSRSEQAWSLLYCDLGGAQLRAGARDLALLPHHALLVAPGALYTLQPHSDLQEWGYHWTVFHPDSRWRDWLIWPAFATQISLLPIPQDIQAPVLIAFNDLEHCLQSSRAMTAELSHNLLEQLILRCRACLPTDFQPHRDPRIARAREFVEQHYRDSFTLADVARACSLSASRLSGVFRNQCGLTVLGYRDELRMVEAARLLRNSSLGIAAIGAQVGYPDPAYFSRTFSRHVGVSPREYRSQG